MERYRCSTHSIIITIPNTEREFYIGKYHQSIEKCVSHIKEFPDCKFIKIGDRGFFTFHYGFSSGYFSLQSTSPLPTT